MFDLDDITDFGKDFLVEAVETTDALTEKVIEVIKEEAPHIAHKAGEVIEEIIKHK